LKLLGSPLLELDEVSFVDLGELVEACGLRASPPTRVHGLAVEAVG